MGIAALLRDSFKEKSKRSWSDLSDSLFVQTPISTVWDRAKAIWCGINNNKGHKDSDEKSEELVAKFSTNFASKEFFVIINSENHFSFRNSLNKYS